MSTDTLSPADARHVRWINKAESWGAWMRFSDTEAADPEVIWMLRAPSGRVRFYGEGRGQMGKEHASIVAASYWAWADRWLWLDEDGQLDILAQLECRKWVLDGGAAEKAS